jgi:hypothetical protein
MVNGSAFFLHKKAASPLLTPVAIENGDAASYSIKKFAFLCAAYTCLPSALF